MSIVLRPGKTADAAACGTICYEAFKAIGTAHNFPPDFPSPQVASGLLSMLLAHPSFYSVVAENEGRIVGSNFLDERSCIAGVGPLSVDPTIQNRGVGGRLMQEVLDRAARRQAAGVRLLQSGFHNRSLIWVLHVAEEADLFWPFEFNENLHFRDWFRFRCRFWLL
jgi:predicted N-acetyltransferase YhbS